MMNSLKIIAIASLVGLCVVEVAQAAPPPPVGQWQCYATNNRGMRWYQNSVSRHRALARVRQRCYAAGSRRCYADKGQCRYNQGKFWTCRVQDHKGRVFTHSATTANDACYDAKRRCRRWHNNRGIQNYMCKIISENRT